MLWVTFMVGIGIVLVFSWMLVPGYSDVPNKSQDLVAWAAIAEVSNMMMMGIGDSSPFQSDSMINHSFASRYSVCSKCNYPPNIFRPHVCMLLVIYLLDVAHFPTRIIWKPVSKFWISDDVTKHCVCVCVNVRRYLNISAFGVVNPPKINYV